MVRGLRIAGLVLTAVLAVAIVTAVAARIEPLLPTGDGDVCFAGTFDGAQPLAFGRPTQATGQAAHIERLTLRLTRTEERSDPRSSYRFDRRYNFTLAADVRRHGSLRGGGQCDWNDDPLSRVMPDLACFIDCDGGVITFWRVPLRRALFVRWGAGDYLRMASCGEPGAILSAPGEGRMFQLESVPLERCSQATP
jgi:hypothetical protein